MFGTTALCNIAALLRSPGIDGPAEAIVVDTGVLRSSPSELSWCSGVWTAM